MYEQLLANYPIISDQISRAALGVVLRELEKILEQGIKGDIAEFGCYVGTTNLFIRRLLDAFEESGERHLYAYDSFDGLPPKTIEDASATGTDFKAGELKASKRQFLREFKRANLKPPIIYKAWFSDLKNEQLPKKIAFAFLDGDFYSSILDSLRLTWPRLEVGGTITIDDYNNDKLPGVERALRDFFQGKLPSIQQEHNIGILRKS